MKQILTLLALGAMFALLAGTALAQTELQNQGEATRVLNYENVPGADGNGGTVRNGDEYFQVGEAHGPEGPGNDANKLFIDEDGDGFDDAFQAAVAEKSGPHGDGDGVCDGTGEGNGNGDGTGDGVCDGTGEGSGQGTGDGDGTGNQYGNHYGDGDGVCDDLDPVKVLSQTMDQVMAGELLQHSWGPGVAQPDSPVGPIDEGSFGPGESSGDGGAGDPVADVDPIRSRAGRR